MHLSQIRAQIPPLCPTLHALGLLSHADSDRAASWRWLDAPSVKHLSGGRRSVTRNRPSGPATRATLSLQKEQGGSNRSAPVERKVMFLSGLKSFGILVGTFAVVYVLTPFAVQMIIRWFPIDHPERVQSGFAILATITVYNLLRRVLGQKMPVV